LNLDVSERGLCSLHAYLGELVRLKQDRIGRGDPDDPAPILSNQIAELRVLQAKIQDTLQQNLVCT
jgi:hypothetical protein